MNLVMASTSSILLLLTTLAFLTINTCQATRHLPDTATAASPATPVIPKPIPYRIPLKHSRWPMPSLPPKRDVQKPCKPTWPPMPTFPKPFVPRKPYMWHMPKPRLPPVPVVPVLQKPVVPPMPPASPTTPGVALPPLPGMPTFPVGAEPPMPSAAKRSGSRP